MQYINIQLMTKSLENKKWYVRLIRTVIRLFRQEQNNSSRVFKDFVKWN